MAAKQLSNDEVCAFLQETDEEVVDDSDEEIIPCEDSEVEDRVSFIEDDYSSSSLGSNECDDDYITSRDGTK